MKLNEFKKYVQNCEIVITPNGLKAIKLLTEDDEILTNDGFVTVKGLTEYNPHTVNTMNIRECLGEHFDDYEYRKAFYKEYGYSIDALDDENHIIRRRANEFLGWSSKAFKSTEEWVRATAYEKLGYTEDALSDVSSNIRYSAYEKLGWTVKAFTDSQYKIRKSAYDKLGYTTESLNDEDIVIVYAAMAYFAKQLPTGDDIRYAVHYDNKGFFVGLDDEDEWQFSDDIQYAKLYKSITRAIDRGTGGEGAPPSGILDDERGIMRYTIKAVRLEQKITPL